MAEKAGKQFGMAIENSKNIEAEKFDVKYLEEAMKMKGMTTGAIENEVLPQWMRIPQPAEQAVKTKSLAKSPSISLWQRIKNLFIKDKSI